MSLLSPPSLSVVLFLYLILLFTVLPLTEFSLLWWLAGSIGLAKTVVLVLGTGFLGAALAKQQGVATLFRIRQQLASNQMPTDALFDGALILVAGAVLITPGVLTDAMGFGLLIPPVRAVVKQGLRTWAARNVRVEMHGFAQPQPKPASSDSVIDVEATHTRVED
ncbi:MAG: FxsA family protein [Planctomycetota bacterium]